jgi:hypothetical protein
MLTPPDLNSVHDRRLSMSSLIAMHDLRVSSVAFISRPASAKSLTAQSNAYGRYLHRVDTLRKTIARWRKSSPRRNLILDQARQRKLTKRIEDAVCEWGMAKMSATERSLPSRFRLFGQQTRLANEIFPRAAEQLFVDLIAESCSRSQVEYCKAAAARCAELVRTRLLRIAYEVTGEKLTRLITEMVRVEAASLSRCIIGRPSKFSLAQKNRALQMKRGGETNRAIASYLHGVERPSRSQIQNVPNQIKQFRKILSLVI